MSPKGEHHHFNQHHEDDQEHRISRHAPAVHLVHHSSLRTHSQSSRESSRSPARVRSLGSYTHSPLHRLNQNNGHGYSLDIALSRMSCQASPPLRFYPRWTNLPQPVLEAICSYLSVSDVRNCTLTCKKWCRILSDESSEVWKTLCQNKLPKSALKGDLLSSLPTFKAKLRAHCYAWDSNECSRNIYIKTNGFTLHRNPVAQSTDAARGKIGLSRGRHCWEVWWEGPLGTVAVVGVATREAPLQSPGYVALLGSNSESWGWNLVDNHLLHNGECLGSFPLQNNAPKYQTGEKLRVILDCDLHTLSFERDYEFLGVAFRGLPKKPLYPAVSAVYGNTEASMVYLGYPLDG